jgi:hypothetical protein
MVPKDVPKDHSICIVRAKLWPLASTFLQNASNYLQIDVA